MRPASIALLLAALGTLMVGLATSPRPALAHLDLVETRPAEGATVASPVSRVVLRFTVAGEAVGPGIRIVDERGDAVRAEVRATAGGTTFELTPSSPLEGGRFGVAWRVAAPDAHPKSGSFRFAVATPGAAPAAEGDGDDALAAALEAPDDRGATALGLVGRVLAYGGGLVAIGGLAFLSLAMVGTRREVMRCFGLMRLAGALVVVGGLIGIVARGWLLDGGGPASGLSPWAVGGATSSGEAGLSLLLVVAGGILVAQGARPAFRTAPPVAVAGEAWRADDATRIVGASVRNAVPAIVGCGAVAFGLALDGHSASEGPRALVWMADLVHASAAGVWFGGVILLALIIGWRRRARRNANASYAAVRFATLAGAGVALAGLTGTLLAVVVLPGPSALWGSNWGLLLMAKVGLVGCVAAIGAYNHFRLIPRLSAMLDAPSGATVSASPVAEEVALTLRRNAAAELCLLGAVVIVTAALVGASAV